MQKFFYKRLEHTGNAKFRVSLCAMKGLRNKMEDNHAVHLADHWGFFGVFDGHGGKACSRFCASEFTEKVKAAQPPIEDNELTRIIFEVDERWLYQNTDEGSTAVMALISEPKKSRRNGQTPNTFDIQIANVGDSRGLLLRQNGEVEELTCDHSPQRELARIQQAGGFVRRGYVNGRLAMGRAMGNKSLKKNNVVIADPDILHTTFTTGDYCLLFCDGIVERASNQDVSQYVGQRLFVEKREPAQVASDLCDWALCSGSRDNMTVMIIEALPEAQEWEEKRRDSSDLHFTSEKVMPTLEESHRILAKHQPNRK